MVLERKQNKFYTRLETAVFGGGCFWCTEAVFKELAGVEGVTSGYSGGDSALRNPTYEEVSTGTTGYAESIRVLFNSEKISYGELLEVFWNTHDPTTPDRQGPDVGTQYRSVIFYRDENQKKSAEDSKKQAEKSGKWNNPIVTQIVPLQKFFPAEEYHQNYFEKNSPAPYCQVVIAPKIEKLRKDFKNKIKYAC